MSRMTPSSNNQQSSQEHSMSSKYDFFTYNDDPWQVSSDLTADLETISI